MDTTELQFYAFEQTPDLVCIAGRDGYFKKINPAVVRHLEYTEEELKSRPISSFMHPEDREHTANERKKLLQGHTLHNLQNRYIAKSGRIIWLEWTSIYVPEKEMVFAIAKDITQRKEQEKLVEDKFKKFKSLASHFKKSIEKDRKYLALELHEELAQLASVVKMDIDWLKTHLDHLPKPAEERMDHALMVSGLLINTIRRVSFAISPQMLDDLDLDEALQWQCKEFSLLNGIPCHLETNYTPQEIPHEIKLDFFRICQEALSNVMYHAAASKVIVSLQICSNEMRLTITDNGKGFHTEMDKPTHGIDSMRERASSINGELLVDSRPGTGTTISVAVPLQQEVV